MTEKTRVHLTAKAKFDISMLSKCTVKIEDLTPTEANELLHMHNSEQISFSELGDGDKIITVEGNEQGIMEYTLINIISLG